ncbi:MAG TPA: ABC transporter permease [Stellaceae bacterium]|jgi:peptide/nickel transport system permease protein|nr:ABC transporter permease [Stellaceae bacterium]
MADIAAVQRIAAPEVAEGIAPRGYWRTVAGRVRRDRLTVTAGAILLAIVLLAIFAPWAATHDPLQGDILHRLEPVGTPGHLLGTDETGRDIWSRLVYGGRLSLFCGLSPVLLATIIGGVLGLLAGMGGRLLNSLIMRICDVFYAFPSVLLAIAICGVIGAGIANTILSLTVVFIPPLVRVTESLTRQVRSRDFVEAARASAAPLHAIIRHQILPNVLGGMLVYATSLVGISIILSAGLSFLGLGVTPPAAEWGLMLNALRQAIFVEPTVAALPGVAIVITSLCFNLLSDGLRSAMDVKLPS